MLLLAITSSAKWVHIATNEHMFDRMIFKARIATSDDALDRDSCSFVGGIVLLGLGLLSWRRGKACSSGVAQKGGYRHYMKLKTWLRLRLKRRLMKWSGTQFTGRSRYGRFLTSALPTLPPVRREACQ
jgi:hypothetical protein